MLRGPKGGALGTEAYNVRRKREIGWIKNM